jgi:hypothetical protein
MAYLFILERDLLKLIQYFSSSFKNQKTAKSTLITVFYNFY